MATMERKPSAPGIELAELRSSSKTSSPAASASANPRNEHLGLNPDGSAPATTQNENGEGEPLIQKNELSEAVNKEQKETKQQRLQQQEQQKQNEETKQAPPPPSEKASAAEGEAVGDDVLLDINADIPEPNYPEDYTTATLVQQLADLRDKDKDILENFVDNFRQEAPDQEIIVGSVDVEEIALQEREFEEQRIQEVQEHSRRHQQREIDLLHRERVARATVETERLALRERHREREKHLVKQTKTNRERLKIFFRQAEDKLKRAIKSEQGAVHEVYGDLESGERTTLRRWRASWHHKPVPLQIDIKKITAVKDKIPAGVYVLLVSMFDRLGGKPLKWSKADAGLYEKLKPSTQPLVHKGRFYDIDMRVNQSVFVVAPSESKVEPSMCFVFELYRLADKKIPVDRCMGWAAMPVCDAHLQIAHGKFKLPLLCGPINRKLNRYNLMTDWYSEDLNRWLANIYFTVEHLPREVIKRGKAMKEYDVELAISGQLLGLHTLPATDEKGDIHEYHSPEQVYESVDISAKVRAAQLKNLVKSSGPQSKGDEATEFEDYRMAMQDDRGRHDAGQLKLRFMWWAVFADFGMSQVTKPQFWLGVVLLLGAFLLRIYVHYSSQFLVLWGLDIPVYSVTYSPFTVVLKFSDEGTSLFWEALIVASGPLGSCVLFSLLILFEYLSNACGAGVGLWSHFNCFFGIFAVLDPILVLLVDLIIGNFDCASQPICEVDISAEGCFCVEGDAFRLALFTEQQSSSAVIGILLTLALYVLICVLAALLLSVYFMRVYVDGRIRDLYRRVHGTERSFFIPEDLELSTSELEWIIVKADKWRNPSGATRKAYVCDYELTDPLDPQFKLVTSHLAIYTVEVGGAKKLYRHFLKKPDGCLMEVFGDVSSQLQKEQTALERLLVEQGQGGYDNSPL